MLKYSGITLEAPKGLPIRTVYRSAPLELLDDVAMPAPQRDDFWRVGDAPGRWDVSLSLQIVEQLRRLLPQSRNSDRRSAA